MMAKDSLPAPSLRLQESFDAIHSSELSQCALSATAIGKLVAAANAAEMKVTKVRKLNGPCQVMAKHRCHSSSSEKRFPLLVGAELHVFFCHWLKHLQFPYFCVCNEHEQKCPVHSLGKSSAGTRSALVCCRALRFENAECLPCRVVLLLMRLVEPAFFRMWRQPMEAQPSLPLEFPVP